MPATTPIERPATRSSLLAVGAAVGALLALGQGGVVQGGILVATAGVVVLGIGFGGYRRGYGVSGALGGVLGIGLWAGSIGLVIGGAGGMSALIQAVPGLVGLLIVGLAVIPLRGSGSRTLLELGTGLVFLSILATGLFRAVGIVGLVTATVATVVAWDVGEHGISIGEMLGRQARTTRIEATHAVSSVAVGLLAVGATLVTRSVASGGLSLAGFVIAVLAMLFLLAALHS